MTDQAKESFSSWLDDSATELDIQRMLNELDKNPGLMDEFKSIAQCKQAIGGSTVDLSDRISQEIASLEQGGEPLLADSVVSQQQDHEKDTQSNGNTWIKFGVAASVAFAVVLGARFISTDTGPEPTLAQQAEPAETLTPEQSQQLMASQERLQQYMREHAQQAAFTSGHAVMPFVRSADIAVDTDAE